jgi:UDP:flavonoid glycosyltransferase YjiC (YdhE family)
MASVFAYTSPARGHLFPLVPTLLELRARGHRVHVRTLADDVARMESLGLSASAMDPAIEALELDDYKASSPPAALDRALGVWLARARHEVEDVKAGLAASRAEVALVDVNSWGAIAAAEASRLPLAIFAPYFLPLDLPGRPTFGLGLAPSDGVLARWRDSLLWSVTRFMTRKHLHGAEEPRSERPLVLVTCSTEFQDDGKLLQTALDALEGEDLDVVATTGALDPAGFRAPANARVVRFAAHGPLLRRAVAVVCHGGMGITQKALAAGVPVCVVPWGRDQNDVGRHVEVAGAGCVLSRSRLGTERMRAAIRATGERRPGAERVAAAFAASGGASAAADVIDELVPRAPTRSGHASASAA